jgi:glycosyltransferase involved in cell wall biosynthesis
MNVWILDHHADPPDGHATRCFDLSRELVKRRHRVTVFASGFNQYRLREERLRAGERWREGEYEGVKFVWIRTAPYEKNNLDRIASMLGYAWRVFWIGKRFREQPDIIVGSSPHLLAPLSAYGLAWAKRCPFIFEVRDLWPLSLVELGGLSQHSPVTVVLRALEKFLYRRAAKIIMLWPRAHLYTTSLGIPENKVVWIAHVVDFRRFRHLKPYGGGSAGSFTIMYLGRLGLSNDIEVVLQAARALQEAQVDGLRFVFVGGGSGKRLLVDRARELMLQNVEFQDPIPKSEIENVMEQADAFISCLRDIPLYLYGISMNKLCDYMASGRPVILGIKAGHDPVEIAKAGITVAPGNSTLLADAIRRLMAMSASERRQMGLNGIRYVREHHEVSVLADRLERTLKSCIREEASSRASVDRPQTTGKEQCRETIQASKR